MADKTRTVSIIIEAKNNAKKALQEVGLSLGDLAVVATAVTAATGFLAYAFTKITEAAARQEDANMRLAIALASIGENTKSTRDGLQAFASQLEESTTIGDEAIQQMMATLLQLGRVSLQQLPRVTRDTLDLAAAVGMDLGSAADLMAKAAQGSTEQLRRYGIVLDESVPRSQRFAALLKLIENNFGGTAVAAGSTFSGALRRLDNDWDNLLKAMGQAVVENKELRIVFELVHEAITTGTKIVKEHSAAFSTVILVWAEAAVWLTRLVVQFATWETELLSAQIRVGEFLAVLASLAAALGAFAAKKLGIDPDLLAEASAAAAKMLPRLEELRRGAEGLGAAGEEALKGLEQALANIGKASGPASQGLPKMTGGLKAAQTAADQLNVTLKDLGLTTLQDFSRQTELVDEALKQLEAGLSSGVISSEQYDAILTAITGITQALPAWTENLSAAAMQASRIVDFSLQIADAIDGQAVTAAQNLGDAFIDAALGAKIRWSELFKQILGDLLKVIARMAIARLINFGFGAAAGPGGAVGALSASGGGVGFAQEGGDVVGGILGQDSVRALLTPGEIVLPQSRVEDFEAMTEYAREIRAGRETGRSFNAAFQILPRRDERDIADIIEGITRLVERKGYRLLASEVLP